MLKSTTAWKNTLLSVVAVVTNICYASTPKENLLNVFFAKIHNIHNQSIKSLKVSNASSLQSLTMPEDPATIELNELGQRAGGSSPPIMVGGNAKTNKNSKTANTQNL